jgi:L-asparagine oxygenase
MEPLTDQARDALLELKIALLATLRGAPLDVGDLLVIDNRTTIHGRAPFAARFDGTDRWLRRCFAVSDIRRSRGVREPGSRVCDPLTTIGVTTGVTGTAPTVRIEEPAWTSS